MKIYLNFNSSLEIVRLKLEGDGTLVIDSMKKEHKEALVYELVNLILDYTPSHLEFTSNENELLLQELLARGVKYDETTNKLSY